MRINQELARGYLMKTRLYPISLEMQDLEYFPFCSLRGATTRMAAPCKEEQRRNGQKGKYYKPAVSMILGILLICMLMLTSACGFHLRGSQLTEFNVANNLYINPSSAPLLAKEVKSQLSSAGVSLTGSAQSASYVITLNEERFEKSVLSVSASTGKVEEYQIVYKAKMDVTHSDGRNIIENDKIRSSRDFTFDENAVLGKFSEEEILHEDLVRRAASQVLRRLQALLTTNK